MNNYIIAKIIGLILLTSSITSCQNNPYVQGKRIYDATCANCHMEQGEGLGTMFPPLANTDFLKNNWDQFACIVHNGISGKLIVNGVEYDEVMPPHPKLTAAEMTNLLNFIKHEWYENPTVVNIKDIEAELAKCKN